MAISTDPGFSVSTSTPKSVHSPKMNEIKIVRLPEEILTYLCTFLDIRSLMLLRLACKKFKIISEDNLLWKRFYSLTWRTLPDSVNNWKERYQNDLDSFVRKEPEIFPFKTKVDKKNFLNVHGSIIAVPDLKEKVLKTIDLSSRAEVSMGDSAPKSLFPIFLKESTFSIWDFEKKCHWVIQLDRSINCATYSDNLIATGSDRTIHIWNMYNGKCMHILKRHAYAIRDLWMTKEFLISTSSDDRTPLVWNLNSGAFLFGLTETKRLINSIIVHDHFAVGSSWDGVILVWDLSQQGKIVSRLFEKNKKIYNVLTGFEDFILVEAMKGNVLEIWDFKTQKLIRSLNGHQSATSTAQIVWPYIYTSSLDGTFKIWSFDKGTCLKTFELYHPEDAELTKSERLISLPPRSTVDLFKIIENRFICCLMGDRQIKVLNFNLISTQQRVTPSSD